VHADAEEIGRLAQHGVGVAHCPRSNGYLGCGVAPLRELREAGTFGYTQQAPSNAHLNAVMDKYRSR
jgi:cytosine/adenosine deaminase-related metal-dependent hydrolase